MSDPSEALAPASPVIDWDLPDAVSDHLQQTLSDSLPPELLETLGLDTATLMLPVGATIIPSDRRESFADPDEIIERLPRMTTSTTALTRPDLHMHTTLGEGGMGRVVLAEQVPMGRHVAVKTLREDVEVSGRLRAILQEAWVTGWLEHPNIIPIYTLGRDHQGNPLIVMKRVEGSAWWDILHPGDTDAAPRSLEWHLDVLIQVCHAMEYAHTRGIVHRDLKPENVMIGRFGEVYVLDWGIAVSLREDLDGRLPMAEHSVKLAGTPAYMAPEMVAGDEVVDERADIFLLGAILHELLTGGPPHSGGAMHAVLFQAYHARPHDYAEDVPEELAAICRRAMARVRDDRYQDVAAMRADLEGYLEHKTSIDLATQAAAPLARLTDHCAPDEGSARDEAEQERLIHATFAECHFGYQQALRLWPENRRAREGLAQSLTLMIEHEVSRRHLDAARALLAELHELGDPPEHLTARIDALAEALRDDAHRRARLEQLAQEVSLSVGRKARRNLAWLLAIIWTALPLANGLREDLTGYTVDPSGFVFGAVRVFVFGLLGILLFRKKLLANQANRRLTIGLIGLLTQLLTLRVIGAMTGINPAHSIAFEVLNYGFFTFMLGVLSSPRISAAALIYLVGSLAIAAYPQLDDYIVALCNLLALGYIGAVWYQEDRAQDAQTTD